MIKNIKKTLPIDDILPQITEYLQSQSTLILQATPGAGKTTRVPPSLLNVTEKNILILEPRRLAARLSAFRVAQEMEEECGETVGYQVRFEKKESKKTRIKFITEGLFLRLLLLSPRLNEVGCVVLDEFHERHIHTDVALMLVNLLQKTTRPDLKLVVMSATLETKSLSNYLPQAKVMVCEAQSYPITVEYLSHDLVQKPLDLKVLFVVENVLKNPIDNGHILVFLPGRFEIAKCMQRLQEIQNAFSFKIYALSADTSFEEQQKIFSETGERKIILATNVAETSITIEGVTVVIDSGLAKIAGHAAWSGFSTLELKPISKSSCIQRSGRAGRTKPGQAIRLFTQYDYNLRPQFEIPEIQRTDLTQTLLEITSLLLSSRGERISDVAGSIQTLPWFEKPVQNALESCAELLYYLDIFNEKSELTEIGKSLSQYALHPRLSRILYEGKKRGFFAQSLLIVSLLSEGMVFKKNVELKGFSHSDVSYQIDILRSLELSSRGSELSSRGLTAGTNRGELSVVDKTQVKKIENLSKQLCANFKIQFRDCFLPIPEKDLSLLLLAGFPDRVCKLRKNEESAKKKTLPEYNLCLGGGAVLLRSSSVVEEEFILALLADESLSKQQSHSTQIQFCHGLDKSLLFDGHPEFIDEKQETFWHLERQTAVCAKRFYYGKIVVKEEQIQGDVQELENILLEELKKYWPKPFESVEALQYFNSRIKLCENNGISLNISCLTEDDFELFLCSICEGKKSFSQILEKDLQDYIEEFVGYENAQKLNSLLPTHITVGKGRKIQVHYEDGKPPFISSRLQDFFGTVQTPRILDNKVSLVVHLLAPNMQSVQVTTDLAGFWERGYQEVRKELSRRYPRHAWPEDPKNAEPPELVKKKRN